MVRLPLILLLFIAHLATLSAQNSRPLVEYNAKDSLEVVQLLAESSLQSPAGSADGPTWHTPWNEATNTWW